MAWTYNSLMSGIKSYVESNLSDYSSYRYVGPYYNVDTNSDFKNASGGLYPTLGIVLDLTKFATDQSMGSTNPRIDLFFVLVTQDTGSRPQDEMPAFYTKVQNLQNMVMATCQQDSTHFGLTSILSAQPLYCDFEPGFIGQKDSNRKGYNVAKFGLELCLTSI